MGMASISRSHETTVNIRIFCVVYLPPDCRRGSWNIFANYPQSGISLFSKLVWSMADLKVRKILKYKSKRVYVSRLFRRHRLLCPLVLAL